MNATGEFGVGYQIYAWDKNQLMYFLYPPLYQIHDVLTTRLPVQLPAYQNIIRPFPLSLWMATAAMLFFMTIVFMTFHSAYQIFEPKDGRLINDVDSKADFFIMTLSTLTEPGSLPWFTNKISGGITLP